MNNRQSKLRIKPSKIKYFGVGYTSKPAVKRTEIVTKLQTRVKSPSKPKIEAKKQKLDSFILPLQSEFKWSEPVPDISNTDVSEAEPTLDQTVQFKWSEPVKDYDQEIKPSS
jgi:hypothetical protein